MLTTHIVERHDGVLRADGVRGYVADAGALYYTARWPDGSTTEHEQGDPAVEGFEWEAGREYDDEVAPDDPAFRAARRDWRFWRVAGPRPDSPAQNEIIPIEADATGHYGFPDE